MIHSRPILGIKFYIRSILSLRTLFHVENSQLVLTLIALEVKCYFKTLDDSLSLTKKKKTPLQTNLSFC